MPDTINPNIPLQAGRGVPSFGPDMQAIADVQRTAIAIANQQRVEQAQNALKALYSNQDNFDPKTLQPTPQAMNALMRISPATGMDLTNNLAAIQEKQTRQQFTQGQVGQQYQDQAQKMRVGALSLYDQYLKTMPPDQAMKRVQEEYWTPQAAELRRNVPPELAQGIPLNFDPVRVRPNAAAYTTAQNAAKDAEQQRKLDQDFEIKDDPGSGIQYRQYKSGRTTSLQGDPYTPTGLAAPQKPPEMFEGTVAGKTERLTPAPGGGWRTADNKPVNDADVSNLHKVGTKAEADADQAMAPTGPQDLHGEEYLKALPPSRADLIKGYAEGRVPIPSSFALGRPAWQKVIADLEQYDPGFDAVNYQARYRTRQDFTSGKSAQNITSFNTAIGHLGTLEKAAEKLDNKNWPLRNTFENWFASNTGDPRLVEFNVAKQAVASELTRAFRGTGGTGGEVKEWEESINSSQSPDQLKGAVAQAVNLLRSRINAVGEQYKRGMGTTSDVMDLLSPAAKKTLASLPGAEDMESETKQPAGQAASAAPAASPAAGVANPKSEQEYNALPSGTRYLYNGQVMVKP